MSVTLTTKAPERGTYVIDASFFDEVGAPVVPKAGLRWKLTDANGTVVNGRTAVGITSAAVIHILLTDLDLAFGEGLVGPDRYLLIEGTYDSTLGSDLPLREQIVFQVDNFVGIVGIT